MPYLSHQSALSHQIRYLETETGSQSVAEGWFAKIRLTQPEKLMFAGAQQVLTGLEQN